MTGKIGNKKAVQSHKWDRHPHDYYTENRWCSVRLFEEHLFGNGIVYDPACGSGRILDAATAIGYHAIGTDLVSRSRHCLLETDFLDPEFPANFFADDVNIVSNPPFQLCQHKSKPAPYAFIRRALDLIGPDHACALLLPATWMNADKTSRFLEETGLTHVYVLTPRPAMPPGTMIEAGFQPGGGKIDFSWYIWDRAYTGPRQLLFLHRDGPTMSNSGPVRKPVHERWIGRLSLIAFKGPGKVDSLDLANQLKLPESVIYNSMHREREASKE